MLSPAKFVCRMRIFGVCAAVGTEIATAIMAATAATPIRNVCVLLIVISLPFHSHDEGAQRLPCRILLRGELLTAAMVWIAAGFLRQRMMDQRTVHAARNCDFLDQLKILLRLLLIPCRRPRRQWHKMKRRIVLRVTNHASRMPRPFC